MKQEYEQTYPNEYVSYEGCNCSPCEYHRIFDKRLLREKRIKTIEWEKSYYDGYVVPSVLFNDDPDQDVKSSWVMKNIYELRHSIFNKLYPNINSIGHDDYGNSILNQCSQVVYFDDYDAIMLSEEDWELEEIPDKGVSLFKILSECKIASSGSEARTLIKQGGIRVNYQKITNEFTKINERWLKTHSTILVQKGKQEVFIIKFRSFKYKDPEITNYDLHTYDPTTKEWIVIKDGLKEYLN